MLNSETNRRPSSSAGYELLQPATARPQRRKRFGNAVTYIAILTFLSISTLLSIGPGANHMRDYVLSKSFLHHNNSSLEEETSPSVSLDSHCRSLIPRNRFICKHERSLKAFTSWKNTQSRSIEEAEKRYRLRYLRNPPPGFAKWVEYALKHNSTLIDEYDQIDSDLAPHRTLTGSEIRRRVQAAYAEKVSSISLLQVNSGIVSYEHQSEINFEDVLKMIEPIAHRLPDLKILINWDDRPISRVGEPAELNSGLIGWEGSKALQCLTETCPTSSHLMREDRPFTFRPSTDICRAASADIKAKHGSFQTGGTAFPYSVAALSNARYSVSADILVPHVVYAQPEYRQDGADTIPFRNKSDSIYWRGSNSGQWNTMDNWNTGHRPRFVLTMLAWKKLAGKSDLLQEGGDRAPPDGEARQALAKLDPTFFDVAFSQMTNCVPDTRPCDMLSSLAPPANWSSPHQSLKHKFLFDLDGNGMSGRFYRLLESNSLVFKQTIFSEWHDDRIVPWVHYIPIDLDFTDLPQLLDFFTHDERGKQIAADIAKNSREWVQSSLRTVDMTLYYYRLLLEYAALYNTP